MDIVVVKERLVILFMLDIKKIKYKYLIITISCIVFNLIYLQFANGLNSNYLNYMFIVPFVTFIIDNIFFSNDYLLCFVITIILALTLEGIFEIAGTSSNYTQYYYFLAGIIFILGVFSAYFKKGHKK